MQTVKYVQEETQFYALSNFGFFATFLTTIRTGQFGRSDALTRGNLTVDVCRILIRAPAHLRTES
jgi:hypothetical protein